MRLLHNDKVTHTQLWMVCKLCLGQKHGHWHTPQSIYMGGFVESLMMPEPSGHH